MFKKPVKMSPASSAPFLRAVFTVLASLAVASFLVGVAWVVLAALNGPIPPATGEIWFAILTMGALVMAILGGYVWGRAQAASSPALAFHANPSASLQPALRETREKLAEAGELLRTTRKDGIARVHAALTLRNLLEQQVKASVPAQVGVSDQTLARYSQYAEKAAGRAQEERLGLLRLSRVLLEASLALHRAQTLSRPRGTVAPVPPRRSRGWRRPRHRATREFLSYLDHRFGPRADRN